MKKKVLHILKGDFLFDSGAMKQWAFFAYIIILVVLMITSGHRFDKKAIQVIDLSKRSKEMRALFIATRSEAVKLKLETTIKKRVEKRGLFPSETPPYKIIVTRSKKD